MSTINAIEIRANQLGPDDFISLPVVQPDGSVTGGEISTDIVDDKDVLVTGFDFAAPEHQEAMMKLKDEGIFYGTKATPRSVTIARESDSVVPLSVWVQYTSERGTWNFEDMLIEEGIETYKLLERFEQQAINQNLEHEVDLQQCAKTNCGVMYLGSDVMVAIPLYAGEAAACIKLHDGAPVSEPLLYSAAVKILNNPENQFVIKREFECDVTGEHLQLVVFLDRDYTEHVMIINHDMYADEHDTACQ